MHSWLRVCVVVQLFLVSSMFSGNAAAQGSPEGGDLLVPIAPCRILDTSSPAEQHEPSASREVDIRSHRCGRIVPAIATGFSVRVTRISRTAPEKLPPGVSPVTEAVRKIPAPADGRLSFPVPRDESVGVDVVGYYVAAGTPINPKITATDSDVSAAMRSGSGPAKEETTTNISGTAGSIHLDGEYLSGAGVSLVATPAAPSITANLGNSNGGASLSIRSTASEFMRVRSDGAVQLMSPAGFFDGRTDFFGTPGTYYGYVTVPTNVVHDVKLVNPYDAASTNASRLVFFNAWTDAENGSPPITKFRARTEGYYAQENVNFESIVHWHRADQYHFRAVSSVESGTAHYANFTTPNPGKPTFWVKAATNYDSGSQTRADMYVSGRTGIGTPTPGTHLEVVGNDTNAPGTAVQISSGVGAGTAWANQVNITNASGAYGLLLGFNGPGRTPLLYHNPNGAHLVNVQNGPLTLGTSNVARVTVAGSGAVGIGTAVPQHSLDVSGNMTVGTSYTSSANVPPNSLVVEGNVGIGTNVPNARLHVAGNIIATGSITGASVIGAVYQDVAEWVPATSDMTPGTVVVLNPDRNNEVMPSALEYDVRVAGVVSAQPGLILGVAAETKEMIATTGRVKVKVDATRAPIRIGDLLVSSGKSGSAMKSEPMLINGRSFHQPGTIIGKALEPLAGGEGEILVLLSLQ